MDLKQLHNGTFFNSDADLYGTNDVDHDGDTPTVGLLPFADIEYLLEDHKIVYKQKHPANSQWQDTDVPHVRNASAVIGGTHQTMRFQAKNKIEFIKNKVKVG